MTDLISKRGGSFQQNLMRKLGETLKKYEDYEKFKDQQGQSTFTKLSPPQRQLERNLEGFRALYPGLLSQDVPDRYSFLVSPENLSPLLKALYAENQMLQEELKYCTQDLFKFINLNDTLIEENKSLVQHLVEKDQDLRRVIESASLNECEEINDLKHQIQFLQEESHILLEHVQQQKRKEEESKQINQKFLARINELQTKIESQNQTIQSASQREEELTKQIFLIQPKLEEQAEEVSQLRAQVQDLEKQIEYLKMDNTVLTKKYSELEYEDQQNIMEKIERLEKQSNHIYELSYQLDIAKKDNERLYSDNQYFHNESESLKSEYYQLTKQVSELTQALVASKGQTQIEKNRVEFYVSNEEQYIKEAWFYKEENQKMAFDVKELQRQLKIIDEHNQEDKLDREQKFEKHLSKQKQSLQSDFISIKDKFTANLKEKEEAILELEKSLQEANEKLLQLDHEVEMRSQQIVENNQKLLDYKQLKMIIDTQSYEIRQTEEHILIYKTTIADLNEELDKKQQSFEDSMQMMQKNIQNLESIIDEQNEVIQTHKQQKQSIEEEVNIATAKLRDHATQLEREVQAHQNEHKRLIEEINSQKQNQEKYAQMDAYLLGLQHENQYLRNQIIDIERERAKFKSNEQQQKFQQTLPRRENPYTAKQLSKSPIEISKEQDPVKYGKQRSPPTQDIRTHIPPSPTYQSPKDAKPQKPPQRQSTQDPSGILSNSPYKKR